MNPLLPLPMGMQIFCLLSLAVPIACISWTITHEEVLREAREFCQERSQNCRTLIQRKFFYLLTCEYCLSHYVAAILVVFTGYRLILDDWRGYLLSWLALVWIANVYMSLFSRLRVDIRSERAEAEVRTREVAVKEKQLKRIERQLHR